LFCKWQKFSTSATLLIVSLIVTDLPDPARSGNAAAQVNGAGMSSTPMRAAAPTPEKPAAVPLEIPFPDADGKIYFSGENGLRKATTINPYLQMRLQAYIRDRGNPIATVVVADVRTGRILAMAQGKAPETWGSASHTALHAKFPAASLFKTIVTAAAVELAGYDVDTPIGLIGGCANVQPNGIWMHDYPLRQQRKRTGMSLRRAYGHSCNNFFAKLAIDEVGIGPISEYATRFGFGAPPPADFYTETIHLNVPTPENSSAYTVGRFAAGFGPASTSAVHIAWQMVALANDGVARPLVLFNDTQVEDFPAGSQAAEINRVVDADTARQIRDVMAATVRGGTASSAFRRGRYKKLRDYVGGKTGTLTGKTPEGLTTLFSGMAPLDAQPEVVVATIVLLQDRWIIKAPILAAEAFSAYFDMRNNNITSMNDPVSMRPGPMLAKQFKKTQAKRTTRKKKSNTH